jgi:transcriptional regulator with PAS, ATPase and Fis domain
MDRNGAVDGDQFFLNSSLMRGVLSMVKRVAGTDLTVLVWGESGVGKEVVARTLHRRSPRGDRPFIKVNCAALPLELLESELFGYERGAFTGAHAQKPGKFELANGGTMFLDEIAEMPLPLQSKLLHVLQDGQFSRLGSRQDIRVDVRVIAATNKNLAHLVELGAFREDLYYRLNVLNIFVPPLRDRREEIPVLAQEFLARYAGQYARPRPTLSAETLALFLSYNWPGNVRQLENIVKRIVVLATEDWVTRELSSESREPQRAALVASPPRALDPTNGVSLREIVGRASRDAERVVLREVLDRVHWRRLEAAQRLGISYKTLLRKIKALDLRD